MSVACSQIFNHSAFVWACKSYFSKKRKGKKNPCLPLTWHRNWAVAYFQWSEVIVVMSPPVLLTAWWQCCESRGLSWLLLLDCGTEARVCVCFGLWVWCGRLCCGALGCDTSSWFLPPFDMCEAGSECLLMAGGSMKPFSVFSLPRYPGFEQQCWRSDPSRRPVRSRRLDFRDVLGFLTYFQLCYVKSPASWLVSRLPRSLPRSPYR